MAALPAARAARKHAPNVLRELSAGEREAGRDAGRAVAWPRHVPWRAQAQEAPIEAEGRGSRVIAI